MGARFRQTSGAAGHHPDFATAGVHRAAYTGPVSYTHLAFDNNDTPATIANLEDLIRLTGKTDYWNKLLRFQRQDEKEDRNLLMIYRVMYNTQEMCIRDSRGFDLDRRGPAGNNAACEHERTRAPPQGLGASQTLRPPRCVGKVRQKRHQRFIRRRHGCGMTPPRRNIARTTRRHRQRLDLLHSGARFAAPAAGSPRGLRAPSRACSAGRICVSLFTSRRENHGMPRILEGRVHGANLES